MLGCLREEEIIASCCLIDTKLQDLPELQGVQEHIGGMDAAVCGGGKHSWLLQVNKQHHVQGSGCQPGAVPSAS